MFFVPVVFLDAPQTGKAAFITPSFPGLNATLTTTTPNKKTFSVSAWAKPSSVTDSKNKALVFSGSSWTSYTMGYLDPTTSTKRVRLTSVEASATVAAAQTANATMTTSAWTHYLLAVDTTQATAANRVKFYVNGSLVSHSGGTEPSQNADMHWLNTGEPFYIGSSISADDMLAGKIAFIDVVDGLQISPSDVVVDISGTLYAKDCTRVHGTNGLKLWGDTGLTDAYRGVVFSGTSISYDRIDLPQYSQQPIALGATMTSGGSASAYTTISGVQVFVTTTGAGSYAVPTGNVCTKIEGIGGGAPGGAGSYNSVAGSGGGSGAYALISPSVSAGTTIYYSVGAAATDTWANITTNAAPSSAANGIVAKGASGTTGGSSATSVGTTKYAGGNGGDPSSTSYGAAGGGGGASAAWTGGAGTNGGNGSGSSNDPGTGATGHPTCFDSTHGAGGGGNGGAGGSSGQSGAAGSLYGGGGGGGGSYYDSEFGGPGVGGAGRQGILVFTLSARL